MTDERRYDEDEAAEIFRAAATEREHGSPALPAARGLTLREMQDIGGEVGIAPARIAQAAAAVDLHRATVPRRTELGMPVGVGRTVDLPRAPTDREWALLVAELRETFGAHGRDRSDAGIRAWSNGNLRAYVEPTEAGHRLRMSTVKGDAAPLTRIGFAALLVAALLLVLSFVAGEGASEAAGALFVALAGGATLGYNALRLPRWADQREAQMAHVAARAQALLSEPAPAEPVER